MPPLLLEFWRFFRAQAAHAARQALSGQSAVALLLAKGAAARWLGRGLVSRPCMILSTPLSLPSTAATTVRDLLAWVGFINAAAPQLGVLPAYAHGAHLVLLDGIGLGVGLSAEVRCRGLGLGVLQRWAAPHLTTHLLLC